MARKVTVKMSITKALAEVKKINEKLNELRDVTVASVEKGNTNQFVKAKGLGTPEEFKANTKGLLDKVRDLIERRNVIKLAIAKANLTTEVVVNGKKMSIIQAIDTKDILWKQINIYTKWISDFVKADEVIQEQEVVIQNLTQQSVNAAFGSNQQTKPQVTKDMEASYRAIYEGKICSNYTREQIQKLKDEATEAVSEIDMILSEANSRTDIEVPV